MGARFFEVGAFFDEERLVFGAVAAASRTDAELGFFFVDFVERFGLDGLPLMVRAFFTFFFFEGVVAFFAEAGRFFGEADLIALAGVTLFIDVAFAFFFRVVFFEDGFLEDAVFRCAAGVALAEELFFFERAGAFLGLVVLDFWADDAFFATGAHLTGLVGVERFGRPLEPSICKDRRVYPQPSVGSTDRVWDSFGKSCRHGA